MPNSFVQMDFDKWFDTYKPIKNPYDDNASFNGCMFETYGDEVAFVKEQPQSNIWMYGQGDDGGTFVWDGWGFVNRLGYFITEVPCPPNTDMQMRVSEDELTCDTCDDIIEQDETHKCEGINECYKQIT